MSTDDLLRQILADPADAALRSVYADALMTAGDPRGELIAVETAGRMERRAELRAAHAKTWWPGIPAHRVRSERGFATAVGVDAIAIDQHAELFERELIETVELDNLSGPISYAAAPWQQRVKHLVLCGHNQRAQITALRESPLGAQLESLDWSGAIYNEALGDALPRCRRLAIANTGIGRRISTLLRWKHVGALEELDVRRCLLDAWGLDELLSLDLRSLRVLQLSGNALGDAGTRVLQQRLRHLPALERLELVDCDVSDVTHTAITEREDLPAVLALTGITLELIPTRSGRYGLLVDGVRRKLRFRSVRTEDGLPETITHDWTDCDDAPLEPLYQAIATAPRVITTATSVLIQTSFSTVQEYSRSITTRETVEITLTGERLDVELERHLMLLT